MTMHGTYIEVPPVDNGRARQFGTSPVKALGIVFTNPPRVCCTEAVMKWTPQREGQRLECAACSNVAKSSYGFDEIVKTGRAPDGMPTATLKEGYAFCTLVYERQMWHPNAIETDLEERELRKDGMMDAPQYVMANQRPVDWFNPDSLTVMWLERGMKALIGKIKGEHVGQAAGVDALTDLGSESFGVERY